MSIAKIDVSDIRAAAKTLSAGDEILLSGTVYTARDAAHKRFAAMLDRGEPLPFDMNGAVIYYAGPTPAKPPLPIGSCGPTTSSRMDSFAPRLLSLGLAAMIGKGNRSKAVCDAITENQAVYFAAIGGAGALAAKCISSLEVIAFDDLGCESVKKLTFRGFPLITAIDSHGGNIYLR